MLVERPDDETLWTIRSVDSLQNRSFDAVGSALVDLVGGSHLLHHPILLDQSAGQSELSLPGLVYDSATAGADDSRVVVQAQIRRPAGLTDTTSNHKATLTWFDHHNTGTPGRDEVYGRPITVEKDFVIDWNDDVTGIAIQVPEAPLRSGVYRWTLDFEIAADQVIRTHGETPVIIHRSTETDDFLPGTAIPWQRTAPFGNGWTLDGVPTIALDRGAEETPTGAAGNTAAGDDRLILAFPGAEPKVFDYGVLTRNPASFPRVLPSLAQGSQTNSVHFESGYVDNDEFGKLTARLLPSSPSTLIVPDELVYTAADGTEYVFKRFDRAIHAGDDRNAD